MSGPNPFAQFDAPAADASDNPFAQFDAPKAADPAETHTFRTTGPNGKEIRFTAPANTPDDQIRQLAAKVVGDPRYLRSQIQRGNDVTEKPAVSLGDRFGMGVRDVASGLLGVGDIVGGPLNAATNYATGTHLSTTPFKNAAGYLSDLVGLPVAETGGEKLVSAVNQGAAGALVPIAGGVGSFARSGGAIARSFAANPALQITSGAAGGVAGEGVRQSGGGPALQTLAALGAGVATGGVGAALPRLGGVAPEVTSAGKIILKTLANQGTTPGQAAEALDGAASRGVPLALMDTGDETRGLASALSRKPGPSRTIIRDTVIPRQEAQLDRVQSAIQRDLGPTANVATRSEEMMKQASEAAKPLYDQAYAQPVVSTPHLDSLLSTPFGRSALSRAHTIAANEGRSPTELGFVQDAEGNVSLNPRPGRAIADHLSARDELDAAQEAYKAAKNGPGDVATSLARVEKARQGLRDAETTINNAPDPSAPENAPGYTTQTLDYVKRGMDDVIEAQRNPVTGRLNLDEAGRAQNGVLRKFLAEVDRINPAYGEARAAYSGPAAAASALRKGAAVSTKDAETIGLETRDLHPAELEQYRLGVRSALSKAMEGRTDAADKVKALVGTPKKRAVLAQLFGGSEQFDNFMATLADEQSAAATHARVNTGSPTAPNLADDANLDGLTGAAVNTVVRAVKGQGMLHNAVQTVGDVVKYGAGKSGERVRSELAAGLSETDPVALRLALARAQAARQRYGVLPQSGVVSALSQIQQAQPVSATPPHIARLLR